MTDPGNCWPASSACAARWTCRSSPRGVETQAQFELLKDLGVDTFQGFLLGRPQSLECLLDSIRVCQRGQP